MFYICCRYIVFESLDEGSTPDDFAGMYGNASPKQSFLSKILGHLTRNLPSVAIQTHVCDVDITYLADLVSRQIPVLLLDCTERAFSLTNPGTNLLTRLASESDAFPQISRDQVNQLQVQGSYLSLASRDILLDIGIEMLERKWKVLIENGVTDNLDTSSLAFLHRVISVGSRKSSILQD